ncbi:DegV: EDD domain protein, DegV family [Rubrobacter radiotolerans]|uniref:DegV family protein n=1 Tax=Rubrobacter radiotolerans TaxID=42256 RepID=A0A023X3N3_RUBRA|nr:DegV family protein [Rubrobacter radiotolerans]AHY46659.1 DegV: EDD domain protein, DegV family [Rubrobacter radiotolerans]MDX5894066.1 DegV family protein [Rubrobacter radiotolerans]SMC05101.1 EDD domain protein, DegV family [Rubrobacter radiotolerans DSM 5868]
MTTAIVTDSTTTLTEEERSRPDLRVVPLTFHFGPDETYLDKVDLTNEEFYRRLRESDDFPTTSQPPVGAFVEAYESLAAYDSILALTISSKLSGTFESATSAAGMVDVPVEVVDMRSAEFGSTLILREALRVIDGGGDLREAKRAAEAAARRTEVFFAVGTLDYLAKSGRIGRAQKLFGSALDIRPILRLEDGEVHPYKRVRGRKRQMNALVEGLAPFVREGRRFHFGHIDAEEAANELARKLGVRDPQMAEIGGVVGCHVGPGAFGVACL